MAVKASASITLSFMVDIKATYRYYKLQASTASTPSAPTTYPPSSSSGWDDAEPRYTSGSTNTLYFVDCTVLTNNSFTYSKVSVSSSYEAAKEAYNKAVAAGNTANSANDKIDNLQIGGRNLAESNNIVWCCGVKNTDKSNYVTKGELSFTVAGSDAGFHYDSASDYEPNTEYVLSYYVSKTSGTFSSFAGFHNGKGITYTDFYIDGVKKSSNGYIYDSVLDDGNRHKIEVHYITPSTIIGDSGVHYTYIQPGRGHSTLPFGIKFEGFKLEKGNKATDWTPAPEDVDSAINTKIASVDVEYYLSTSATSLSGGSWQTTAPTWVNGKYMWSRTKITNGAGTVTYKPSSNGTCIAGAKGDTGATGATGATGTGISSITEEYYLSTSKTSQTGGSWTTTPPTWSSGKYIWTRSKIVYTNPSSTVYTTPICDSSWEAANDAAKVATNYIYHDSTNGLQIGDKSSGSWSGTRSQITSNAYNILDQNGNQLASFGATATIGKTSGSNVYIDSDSVDIRNGTTVNASFGASKIELGKNSDAASIKLINNRMTINVARDSFSNNLWANIVSNRLILSSIERNDRFDANAPKGGWSPYISIEGDLEHVRVDNVQGILHTGNIYVGCPEAYISIDKALKDINTYDSIGKITMHGPSINFEADDRLFTKNSNYRIYGGRVIYSNSSGSAGTITLKETAANFSFLEIHYGNSNYQLTTRVYDPHNKKVPLFFDYMVNSTTHQILTKKVTISKTSITTDTSYSGYANIIDGGTIYVGTENSVKIYYVIGFK